MQNTIFKKTLFNAISLLILVHIATAVAVVPGNIYLAELYSVNFSNYIELWGLILLSIVGHLSGIMFGCIILRHFKLRFRSYFNHVFHIPTFLLSIITFLQIVAYLSHYGAHLVVGSIDSDLLLGNVSPLFPGQLGLFFIWAFFIFLIGLGRKSKFLFLLSIACAILLLKKYLIMLIVFYVFVRSSVRDKILIIFFGFMTYAFIDSVRTNSDFSLNFIPLNYVSLSAINFSDIWSRQLFSNNYLYIFNALFGVTSLESALYAEPTSGPGYLGAIFIQGDIVYGSFIAFCVGFYLAFVIKVASLTQYRALYVTPLVYFAILQGLQGFAILHPVMFLLPLIVAKEFSDYAAKVSNPVRCGVKSRKVPIN
jgi:hypothetical protein